MKYQKIINLLDNTPTQPSKFKMKNWAEINDYSRRKCNTNSQIIFKTPMLKPSLCDYSDAYIIVKGTMPVTNMTPQGAATDDNNKQYSKIVRHLLIA